MEKITAALIFTMTFMFSAWSVSAQSSTAYVDSLVKVRDALLSKNAAGTQATNINIMTVDGEDCTLYDFESDLTMLYLYHPDCYACMATIQYVKDNPVLKTLLKEKSLKILAVDLTPDMISLTDNMPPPEGWTLSFNYDGAINSEFAYYIEEYPSIYLLDKDKKVLLKNPSAFALTQYLEEHYQEKNQ